MDGLYNGMCFKMNGLYNGMCFKMDGLYNGMGFIKGMNFLGIYNVKNTLIVRIHGKG
jgi:hypothetical protein